MQPRVSPSRPTELSDRTETSPNSLHASLVPFKEVVDALLNAVGDSDALKTVVAREDYGDFIEFLWRASLRNRLQHDAPSQAVLESAARALDLVITDVTVILPDMPLT